MKPKEKIKELEEEKKGIISYTNELDEQLRQGEISKRKYNQEYKKQYGNQTKEELIKGIHQEKKSLEDKIKHHQRTKIHLGITAGILIILGIISLFSNMPQVPTGMVTSDTRTTKTTIDYDKTFNHYTETQLNLNNLTSLKISGTLKGTSATIKLRINNTEYTIAELNNQEQKNLITGMTTGTNTEPTPEYELNTDKKEYAIGETITLNTQPETNNTSYYIETGTQRIKLEQNTYITEKTGEHQAIALITLTDDIIRTETNFTVNNQTLNTTEANASEQSAELNTTTNKTNTTTNQTNNETTNQTQPETENTLTFTEACLETCNIPETNKPTLIIQPAKNTNITITKLIITQNKKNQAPKQTQKIPDITQTTTQTTTLNLDNYFTDPEGDTIHYDTNNIPEIKTTITGSELTISSQQTGTYTSYIYATDGNQLTTSNTYKISITKGINKTNITTNKTTTAENTQLGCDHPNPNKRPPECLTQEEKPLIGSNVYLTNSNRNNMARITPLGNMILRGQVLENSDNMNPGKEDFRVVRMTSGHEEETIAWIDTQTGDLYLTGNVVEEDYFLEPTPNAYVIQNKKGLNQAYIDRSTGNLHIKGNLIVNKAQINK